MTKYVLHQVDRELANDGCIWVRDDALRNEVEDRRPVLQVKPSKNSFGKSTCCEVLWADDTWLRNRHNPITSIPAGQNLVFISGWYRRRLGIVSRPGSPIDLEITPTRSSLRAMLWQLRACGSHPQIVVAMSTVLAVAGAGLGIMGVGAFLKDLLKDFGVPAEVGFSIALAAFLAGIVVFLLGWGPLLQRGRNSL